MSTITSPDPTLDPGTPQPKRPWIWVVLLIVLLGLLMWVLWPTDSTAPTDPISGEPTEVGQELTQASCEQAGGEWDSCGSACRVEEAENPDIACIQVCMEYCYCTSDGECPSGHRCSDVVEDTGVCVLE